MTGTTLQAILLAISESVPLVDSWRDHGGASGMGAPCLRKVYYDWHWSSLITHSPRILALFRRGREEEKIFTDDLRAAGILVHDVDPDTGKQFRLSDPVYPFLSGSLDGIVWNAPERPNQWLLLELKTMGAKYFRQLVKLGSVRFSHEHYYSQVQLYMLWSHLQPDGELDTRGPGLKSCLFLSVCKDNDERFGEIIEFDVAHAEEIRMRGASILEDWHEPPYPISKSPSYYKCKMCDHFDHCKNDKPAPRNCRTCRHMEPTFRGATHWNCTKHLVEINREGQIEGCEDHQPI